MPPCEGSSQGGVKYCSDPGVKRSGFAQKEDEMLMTKVMGAARK